MIDIDGAQGEGGGQVLRTALGLAIVTGRAVRLRNIRAGRPRPGLLRQHLTAVRAAAAVSDADVRGAEIGSRDVTFVPTAIRGGEYQLQVGTAGSTTLVLQTVLPALLRAGTGTRMVLEGGTHNPSAPPFEFLARTFLPLLRRMGARVEATLEMHGFYPAGGGRIVVRVEPCMRLDPLVLLERGATRVTACARLAHLPAAIAVRELAVVRERLGLDRSAATALTVEAAGPGNALAITLESAAVTEVVTGFGEKGRPAEDVAAAACNDAAAYLATDVPVGMHLADQLLIPLALAGSGAFRTLTPSPHTTTNADVIRRFLDVPIVIEPESPLVSRVVVGPL